MSRIRLSYLITLTLTVILSSCTQETDEVKWEINDLEYLETPGINVLVFHNSYPVGKQGGIEIIQHGERVATN